jgi:putative ABC transport system ATP-binding protein
VNEPPVIFADEPTGNLDEENEQRVLDLLTDLHRQGRTIVMVTHNPALGKFADRIVRLQHGKYLGEEMNPMRMPEVMIAMLLVLLWRL